MNRTLNLAVVLLGMMAVSCEVCGAAALEANEGGEAGFSIHPEMTLRLFAKEPAVVDPVAAAFDERGRMYVVEMRDYPYGVSGKKGGGTIRLLEDQDGNGEADRSVLFAEGLSFPTSIAVWNGGVFVTAPPEIVYLKDTNGDGRADVRQTAYSGFKLGVTDSNVNGLRWALDNRIHGSNGGNSGVVQPARGRAVPLRDLDFRFDPRSGRFETTYLSSAGFGLIFDDGGRSFCTYNINHIQHRIFPARYLERFKGSMPVQLTMSISDHGDMARIFPISTPETRVNHPEQSGHFSSAGGMGYIGSEYPVVGLRNSILICDVVGNLVHRDVIRPEGLSFVASRAPEDTEREFLAGRDRAFRPVGIELGLDGAFYVIDMQRDVIEHPDYIPEKVLKKLDIRAGENRGRIYRMTPRGGLAKERAMDGMSAEELVQELAHWNQTRRLTAQRLIGERQDLTTKPALEALARNGPPLGRLHALWTLEALGELEERQVVRALADPAAMVRENAIQLAELHLTKWPAAARVIARETPLHEKSEFKESRVENEPDPRVRMQLALTAGELPAGTAAGLLGRIFGQDAGSRWARLAVLSSLRSGGEILELARVVMNDPSVAAIEIRAREQLWHELGDSLAGRIGPKEKEVLPEFLKALAGSNLQAREKAGALAGLGAGLERSGMGRSLGRKQKRQVHAVLQTLMEPGQPVLFGAAWKLGRGIDLPETVVQREALARAQAVALDSNQPLRDRLEQIQLLALGEFASVGASLFKLLDAVQWIEVQRGALEVLRGYNELAIARELVERWPVLGPEIRPRALELLLQKRPYHTHLVGALEAGRIQVGELNLDLEQRRRLLRDSTAEVRKRAEKFMSDEEYSNRKAIVEKWLADFPARGDAAKGRAVFEKSCAKCHVMDGVGQAVGPDLRSLRHRSAEDLLSNILDPNMAIGPGYVSYTAEVDSGELISGLLASQNAEAIVLRQAEGKDVLVPRRTIRRLQSSGLSMMPEGLEAGYTAQEMRDLIEFIQRE